jgi:transposase
MPPSLRDWLPEGDMVWFILDTVKQMDVSSFYHKRRPDGWGAASYEPSMMVALLLYAYCMGVLSSREIERLCERDIAFKVITANQKPDHASISRFRKDNSKELEGLFVQILRLCAAAGLVKVGTVALDGTKIEANASLAANRTQEHIEKEVAKRLAEAEATDKKEDKRYGLGKRGDELPEELRDRRSRLERLKACKQRLEREEEAARQKQQGKIEKRQAEEELSGKKRRGRKLKEPDEIALNEKKANVTDPDSRIMKTRKGFVQGYNGQAVVTEQQIIVAADVTQEENDVKQLQPMLSEAEQNLQAVALEEKIGNAVADAGYLSEDNLASETEDGPTLYIATKKDHQQRSEADEKPIPEGLMPEGLSLRERMEWRLSTKEGKEIYKKRSPMSEGVYGQIKSCRDIRRFVRKGLEACRSEWKLICGTHNLLKLYLSGKACCT